MAMTRREARERALEILYEAEMKSSTATEVLGQLPTAPDAFASRLVRGVAGAVEELDDRIAAHLRPDWPIGRLGKVELILLRLGAHELAAGEAPAAVVLAEAVELAKRYGGEGSGRLVNGVLAAIERSTR